MPIVFGAICPHPPLLLPTIGGTNLKKIAKTSQALAQLEGLLYQTKPETIIIISPHGEIMPEVFTINQSPTLTATFEDFGDLETKVAFKNDLGLGYSIRQELETKLPVILTADAKVDHGSSIPLLCLTSHLQDFSIVPIGYSLLSYQKHLEFGQAIRKILENSNKRIAIIASGDLSHRLTKEAPDGYSKRGQEFDNLLIGLLKEKKINDIVNLDPSLIEEAGECGLRSIMILLGIFSEMNFQPEILSYEGPFGVGYLVSNFVF